MWYNVSELKGKNKEAGLELMRTQNEQDRDNNYSIDMHS